MALSHDELTSYTAIIDEVLATVDLESVTTKSIRGHLESRLQTDLTPHKQAVDDLAVQRFNIARGIDVGIKGPTREQLKSKFLFNVSKARIPIATSLENNPAFVPQPNESSSRIFCQFPEEVLSRFVEQSVVETSTYWLCKNHFPGLKALRLACKRFAYNPRLMKVLFRGVRLIATQAQLELLEKADISKIAPYVQRLTFFPPFHSWTLSFDGFKEIVISQAIQRYCLDQGVWTGGGSFTCEDDGYTLFINHFWGGALPFTEDELAHGYEKHMALASEGRHLLDGCKLEEEWIKALMLLSNCRQFRIDSQKYNGHATDIPQVVDCEIHKHHHDRRHREGICRQSAGILGDKVFETAVSCLSRAQIQPTALDLRFSSAGNFGWNSLPGWAQLDLSKLKKLRFHPVAQCLDEWGSLEDAIEVEMDVRACASLDDLLRKCSRTITDLTIKRDCPLTWPREELVPLPELKCIEMDGIMVHNRNFARLLPLMPKLEHYESFCTNGTLEWKEMLDAVRNHKNRMRLNWDQLPCNDCAEVSLRCNTADESDEDQNEDPWMDIWRSLQNYLAGKGRWNKSLRMWFENEDPDASESEGENN